MDLEEWELVSDDGFLKIHDNDNRGKKVFSSKYGINQFVDSTTEESVLPNKQLIPLSIQLDDPIVDLPDIVAKKLTTNIPVQIPESAAPSVESGKQDPKFQVFVKKTEENEFADMKIESPKSGSMEFLPQIEAVAVQFEEKSDGEGIKKNNSEAKVMGEKEEEEEGMDLWKGVGAICSFGMAAATICIMIFGNAQSNKHNQKLRIQIYSDDKRINQVVQQATKLNEAISSAVRGVPLTRAHITSGGYYDGV